MPIHTGKDSKGDYVQWGGHGAKYYYKPNDPESRDRARRKSQKQAAAAHASGFRE